MSNEVTIFDKMASVPAWMQSADDELKNYTSDSYATLSIKGKVFALVRNGERTVLYNPGTRDVLQRINVVILKAGVRPAKRYYAGTFKDDGEAVQPTCFSFDGLRPDAAALSPQCKSCGACKFNQFGTARMLDGTQGKGKACTDYIRLALCAAGKENHDDVFYLAVPAASIKNFNTFCTLLVRHKMPIFGVKTEISFDPAAATPKLRFEAIGIVDDEAEFNHLKEIRDSAVVSNIVNGANHVEATNAPAVPESPVTMVKKPVEAAPVYDAKAAVVDQLLDKLFAKAPTAEVKVVRAAPASVQITPVEPPKAKPEPAKVVSDENDLGSALASLGF